MSNIRSLTYGGFYHIFNRGTNSMSLFRESADYNKFLELYKRYIPMVTDTYCWALLPNHFHFLVKIKEIDSIENMIPEGSKNNVKNRRYVPSNQHAHLFNAYSKHYNKKYERHGSVFENPFKRIRIENEIYLKNLVYYIHNNPVSHGFVNNIEEYEYTSYHTFITKKHTELKRKEVITWFDDVENFVAYHKSKKINFDNPYFIE